MKDSAIFMMNYFAMDPCSVNNHWTMDTSPSIFRCASEKKHHVGKDISTQRGNTQVTAAGLLDQLKVTKIMV